MGSQASQVVAAALELPPDDRAEVIEALVRSLDAGDELDDEDRGRLHDAILRSEEQFRAGQSMPAADVLDRLRQR